MEVVQPATHRWASTAAGYPGIVEDAEDATPGTVEDDPVSPPAPPRTAPAASRRQVQARRRATHRAKTRRITWRVLGWTLAAGLAVVSVGLLRVPGTLGYVLNVAALVALVGLVIGLWPRRPSGRSVDVPAGPAPEIAPLAPFHRVEPAPAPAVTTPVAEWPTAAGWVAEPSVAPESTPEPEAPMPRHVPPPDAAASLPEGSPLGAVSEDAPPAVSLPEAASAAAQVAAHLAEIMRLQKALDAALDSAQEEVRRVVWRTDDEDVEVRQAVVRALVERGAVGRTGDTDDAPIEATAEPSDPGPSFMQRRLYLVENQERRATFGGMTDASEPEPTPVIPTPDSYRKHPTDESTAS
jgi:hypothetical protein